ncbi:MAG: LytTR family DNA-binding domain-containing protein [Pseudomonadota bacterium]
MTRVLLADDEPNLSKRLARLLHQHWPVEQLGDFELIGTAASGIEALEQMRSLKPEVAFLDIQMPGMTGIEVAHTALNEGLTPLLVFVTAFDQYAIEAFDAAAVDYLLKPVAVERLQHCLERLAPRLAQPTRVPGGELTTLLTQLQQHIEAPRQAPLRWLRVGKGDAVELVDVNDVLYFRADQKYTTAVTAAGEHLLRTALKDLAAQLEPDAFWQIHRSLIVRVDAIARAERDLRGRYVLTLKGRRETLRSSLRYSDRFKQM